MTSPTIDRRLGLAGNTAIKAPVTVVATSNITLSGQQTIDGVGVLAVNSAGVPDRVLCVGQTAAAENGIWNVSTSAWSRSVDANGPYDLAHGTLVNVAQGTTYTGTLWMLTTSGAITIGTTSLAWSGVASTTAEANIADIGTVAGISADVTAVAAIAADVSTAAANITDIQNAEENADAAAASEAAAEAAAAAAIAAAGREYFVYITGSPVALGSYPGALSAAAESPITRFYANITDGPCTVEVRVDDVVAHTALDISGEVEHDVSFTIPLEGTLHFVITAGTPTAVWAQVDEGTA